MRKRIDALNKPFTLDFEPTAEEDMEVWNAWADMVCRWDDELDEFADRFGLDYLTRADEIIADIDDLLNS